MRFYTAALGRFLFWQWRKILRFLVSTNQLWKWWGLKIGMTIGWCIIIIAPWYDKKIEPGTLLLSSMGGMVVLIVSFVLALFYIRCPKCDFGLYGYAVTKTPAGSWSKWVEELDVCPRCGFDPEENP